MNAPEYARQNAWVVTFYAYKGGTGRTLALSNVARFLAEELGYRVGIIDLDTDSPGLPHQALSRDLEPDAKIQQRAKVQERIDCAHGFAEMFITRVAEGDPFASRARAFSVSARAVSECAISLDVRGLGALLLMPAGKGSFSKSKEYRLRAAQLNESVSVLKLSTSAKILSKIVDDFVDAFALDFVLIDGRTGTGNFFPAYTYVVPQALVLFLGLNEQNVHGSLSILAQSAPEAIPPAPVMLVASPVPTVNPQSLEDGLQRIARQLARMQEEKDSKHKHYRFVLPNRLDFQLPYCDLATYQEAYFIDKYPNSLLAHEYRRLAKQLQHLAVERSPRSSGEITAFTKATPTEKISIALEDVNYEHFKSFLLKHYEEPEPPPSEEPAIVRFSLKPGKDCMLPGEVELQLWSATSTDAPWEKILSGKARESPDLLMVPQSSLGSLSATNAVWTLERLREKLPLPFLGSDFLDAYYPGWRKWCAYGPWTFGLPFSMTTTLLCVNRPLFERQFASYIGKVYGSDGRGNLFPTSWQQLCRLLSWFTKQSAIEESSKPFGFADEKRALYYEWLNVVLACGGADFRTEEGNFSALPAVSEPETLRGTWLFLNLVKELRSIYEVPRSPESVGAKRRMSDLVKDFNRSQLTMYIAWSDNFLFSPAGAPDSITVRPVQLPQYEAKYERSINDKDLILGQIPRDVRYQRNPLVAGWLMVFPCGNKRTKNIPERTRAALSFAEFFYQPAEQRRLLEIGFPSTSLPLVEERLKELEMQSPQLSEHNRNMKFFLLSLRDGLLRGHWVPAFKGSQDGIGKISLCLEDLIACDADYETMCRKMGQLKNDLRGLLSSRHPSKRSRQSKGQAQGASK